ncbi:hypothetical protein chiPu_0003050 [Chiloscyllium punctatum]|uniref:Uncharacterized protein n=1 Tax=Chiloscyllium punctatum TaxID=137246 RepID=A0A401S2R2_CHIPU|nr:hypothetical protein [Chiloscyllium punctatum]
MSKVTKGISSWVGGAVSRSARVCPLLRGKVALAPAHNVLVLLLTRRRCLSPVPVACCGRSVRCFPAPSCCRHRRRSVRLGASVKLPLCWTPEREPPGFMSRGQ